MPRRRLSGLLYLALAGMFAWGGTVESDKASLRWIVVAAMAGWGLYSLLQERSRIEHVYTHIGALGVAIAAVGWLTPGSNSRGLMAFGMLLVLIMGGLLIWSWSQRDAKRDDTDQPR
jgi:hypothetical protein